jgi:hypothetical protein
VDEKIAQWLEAGTLLVFVVNPRRQTIKVYRPGHDPRELGITDTLDGGEVVPGWTMPVREVFA